MTGCCGGLEDIGRLPNRGGILQPPAVEYRMEEVVPGIPRKYCHMSLRACHRTAALVPLERTVRWEGIAAVQGRSSDKQGCQFEGAVSILESAQLSS